MIRLRVMTRLQLFYHRTRPVGKTAEEEAADTGTVAENVIVRVYTVNPDNSLSWQYIEYEFTRPVPLWNIGWGNSWGNDFE